MPGADASPHAPRMAGGSDEELRSAIGLAWGLVDTGSHEQALTLCNGCLLLWPDCAELLLLKRLAAIETGSAGPEPEPLPLLQRLHWRGLLRVLRRRLGA